MWQVISDDISAQLGHSFTISNKTQLTGGDTHASFLVQCEQLKLFVKLNQHNSLEQFATESRALAAIKHTQTIQVPDVICYGSTAQYAYLVLEYMPLITDSPNAFATFGEQLAGLHLFDQQAMYGWDENNFIGSTPQINNWQKKWGNYFAEQRITYQLTLLKEKNRLFTDIDDFENIIKMQLKQRTPCASLLHGDLWRGNVGFTTLSPVIYDPASYYGDYETDIAMTELFGRFPPEFYQAYYSITAKEQGYENRKAIYNLYHLLNHCNMFAGNYIEKVQQQINRILAF